MNTSNFVMLPCLCLCPWVLTTARWAKCQERNHVFCSYTELCKDYNCHQIVDFNTHTCPGQRNRERKRSKRSPQKQEQQKQYLRNGVLHVCNRLIIEALRLSQSQTSQVWAITCTKQGIRCAELDFILGGSVIFRINKTALP